jgi:hypothetical protein
MNVRNKKTVTIFIVVIFLIEFIISPLLIYSNGYNPASNALSATSYLVVVTNPEICHQPFSEFTANIFVAIFGYKYNVVFTIPPVYPLGLSRGNYLYYFSSDR